VHQVLTNGGKSFPAAADETLLDAALRAGIVVEYSCRTGRCSTCKGRVRSGTTMALHDEVGLSPEERSNGWILTCVRAAASNVELDVNDLGNVVMPPARIVPARIQSLDLLSHDVLRVILRLPPMSKFGYYAGQYVDVVGPAGLRRSYSIANAPAPGNEIELHVRRMAGGAMSQYWFDQAKANDLLRLNGPLGTFFLREVDDLGLVFLATGTGIAPVKAILEDLARCAGKLRPESIHVLWGGRTRDDLYWNADIGLDLQYTPVLSRPPGDWAGARGYVQHVLLERKPDLTRTAVYACGSEAMIDGAKMLLVRAGLPEQRFHADAFVSSATT
jgi:CDP-4-dehydro-6-deoxyglucose reductase